MAAGPPPVSDTSVKRRIHVARERFKFSCAHMTVFADGTKERLHGHNFTVAASCDVRGAALADMIDFAPIKAALGRLCEEWKEHLLLAEQNPHLRVARDDGEELEFTLCGRRYVLPRDEVILLPVDNVTVEALAELCARRLAGELSSALAVGGAGWLEVTVEETPHQGASCRIRLDR